MQKKKANTPVTASVRLSLCKKTFHLITVMVQREPPDPYFPLRQYCGRQCMPYTIWLNPIKHISSEHFHHLFKVAISSNNVTKQLGGICFDVSFKVRMLLEVLPSVYTHTVRSKPSPLWHLNGKHCKMLECFTATWCFMQEQSSQTGMVLNTLQKSGYKSHLYSHPLSTLSSANEGQ